jgi:hypothetical protein
MTGPVHFGMAVIAGIVVLAARRASREQTVTSLRRAWMRLPGRVAVWRQKRNWSGRRTARAVLLGAASIAVVWMLVERLGRLVKVVVDVAGLGA